MFYRDQDQLYLLTTLFLRCAINEVKHIMDYIRCVLLLTCVLAGNSTVMGLYIDGCPMYGCRPSGSFSFYLQVPTSNTSVNWVSDLKMDPLPNPLGCVSDTSSIVCQSNGVFETDKGYVSLQHNGSIAWRDKLLQLPPLPIIDNFGDVTGSDGDKLVHYDQNGKTYPAIPCHNLKPIYNMALVGDSDLLLVSGNGNIVVRQTNGVPVGSLTLNDTVGQTNGTFVPIAQPAINSNENRFYLLTKFVPQKSRDKNTTTQDDIILRVYAIDVHASISDRITLVWNLTLTSYLSSSLDEPTRDGNVFSENMQGLLFDRVNKLLYVNVRVQSNINNKGGERLNGAIYGINDSGKMVFVNSETNVQVMTKFVTDHCSTTGSKSDVSDTVSDSLLWLLTRDQVIQGVDKGGKTVKTYNLNQMFNASVAVTSHVSSVRNSDVDNDTLVFAIVLKKFTSAKFEVNVASSKQSSALKYKSKHVTQTSYVIAIDTGKDDTDKAAISWMVHVPNNMIVRGQISGAGGADVGMKDQLVAYAETPGKSAVYFTIQ